MATTMNYGWTTPDDTNLVKNGASDIRTLANSIDSTVKTNADAAVVKTIVDAKGDLIVGTANDTVSRLAVGSNTQVLRANSATATGLEWATLSAGGYTLITSASFPAAASVTLSSIPTTYRDLVLVINNYRGGSGSASRLRLTMNGVSSGYYDSTSWGASGTSTFGNSFIQASAQQHATVSNHQTIIRISDYASNSWKRVIVLSTANNATTSTSMDFYNTFGYSNNTAAITSITLTDAVNQFVAGSYSLYGVA